MLFDLPGFFFERSTPKFKMTEINDQYEDFINTFFLNEYVETCETFPIEVFREIRSFLPTYHKIGDEKSKDDQDCIAIDLKRKELFSSADM